LAGPTATDAENNAELLRQLASTPERAGHYTCVLVALRSADDPEPLIAEGRWHGRIIDTPRGSGGFGYDPYFLIPELGLTAAELTAAQKNRVSHRGLAMALLADQIAERWSA
jgi:XTP/dITP diphosphohydrolase